MYRYIAQVYTVINAFVFQLHNIHVIIGYIYMIWMCLLKFSVYSYICNSLSLCECCHRVLIQMKALLPLQLFKSLKAQRKWLMQSLHLAQRRDAVWPSTGQTLVRGNCDHFQRVASTHCAHVRQQQHVQLKYYHMSGPMLYVL